MSALELDGASDELLEQVESVTTPVDSAEEDEGEQVLCSLQA